MTKSASLFDLGRAQQSPSQQQQSVTDLESFFRLKRERNETVTPEEAANVVKLVAEGVCLCSVDFCSTCASADSSPVTKKQRNRDLRSLTSLSLCHRHPPSAVPDSLPPTLCLRFRPCSNHLPSVQPTKPDFPTLAQANPQRQRFAVLDQSCLCPPPFPLPDPFQARPNRTTTKSPPRSARCSSRKDSRTRLSLSRRTSPLQIARPRHRKGLWLQQHRAFRPSAAAAANLPMLLQPTRLPLSRPLFVRLLIHNLGQVMLIDLTTSECFNSC